MARLRPFIASVIALLAALVLGACTEGTKVQTGDEPGASSSVPEEDRADLVVRVDVSGGFVPADHAYRSVPTLSIYAGGLALTPGAVIAIYPGPALLPLAGRQMSQRDIDKVLAAAKEHQLDQPPPDYGRPPIADAPFTTVTVVVDDVPFVHRAEALQEAGNDSSSGLTAEQQAARARLREFVNAVSDLPTLVGSEDVGSEETWVPDGYRLQARAASDVPPGTKAQPAPTTSTTTAPSGPTTTGDPDGSVSSPAQPDPAGTQPESGEPQAGEPKPSLWTWPIDEVDLSAVGDCKAVRGEVATKVRDLFQRANDLTRFEQASAPWQVVVRPLLPDDPDCS